MSEFPWDALRGGMLLGLSAALLLVMNGRIAGISGILSGLLKPQKGEFGWRVTFFYRHGRCELNRADAGV